MKETRAWRSALASLCGVALVAAVISSSVIAQVTKGKTRPMHTEQWMEGVMKPNSGALKKGLASTPAGDKAWERLQTSAALLNEASYVLMADGRCPDEVWANAATKTLRDGSAALLEALEAKDLAGAKAAYRATTKACAQCHKKHRKRHEHHE